MSEEARAHVELRMTALLLYQSLAILDMKNDVLGDVDKIAAALREAKAAGLEEAADYLENHLDFGVSGYEFRQEALSWCCTQAQQARKEAP